MSTNSLLRHKRLPFGRAGWATALAVAAFFGPALHAFDAEEGLIEPPARVNAAMVSLGDRLLLTGGRVPASGPVRGGDVFLNDLWEFSVEARAWAELTSLSALPSQERGTLETDLDGNALFFPGFDPFGFSNPALFIFLDAINQLIDLNNPHPDGISGGVNVDSPNRVLLGGGQDSISNPPGRLARTFDKNSSTYTQVTTLNVAAIRGIGFFDPLLDIFGLAFGFDETFMPSFELQLVDDGTGGRSLGGASVVSVPFPQGPGLPPFRSDAAFAQRGDRLVVFGGFDAQLGVLGDLWLVDVSTLAAEAAGGGPITTASFQLLGNFAPRAGASIGFLDDDRVLLFGGFNSSADALAATQIIDLSEPPIFTDGFESGDTDIWSAAVP
ncbi:MAG: kelch repeat-containing protein [Acidobacteriota bacterium]